jgi:gamma-glutamylcyclotransferase (GGCT)/AIG2-like uncharacterized protein YtfP
MSHHSPLQVFVYGTLKPGESNYNRYCEGNVLSVEPAIAPGKLYDFPQLGYPGMMRVESADLATHLATVQGVILSFADPNILKILDELEDYDQTRSPDQNEYLRQTITVTCRGAIATPKTILKNIQKTVWVYVMTHDTIQKLGGIWLPDGIWTGQNKS